MAEFFTAGNCIWVALALVWSAAYAVGSTLAAYNPDPQPVNPFNHYLWWWWYQLVFNAAGALIGWIALYFLWHADFKNPTVGHFVALAVAFLGITGNLPQIALRLQGPKV